MSTDAFKLPWSGRGIDYTEEDIQVVADAMRNADPLTGGAHLKEFESQFSEYHGGFQSFAVASCTAALELTAVLSGVGPGDEVIVPAHTFCATAIPFARRGAQIVWADIDPDFRVVTAETIASRITDKTRVVIVVHLYGLAAPMDGIMELAKEKGILVVEDCAQAIGATYNEHKVGSIGDFGCFSFHGQKNLTTLGEGGMLTVQSSDKAKLVPGLRQFGGRPFPGNRDRYWLPAMSNIDYDIEGVWPFKFSLGEIQCALGVNLLKRLDEISAERQAQAGWVQEAVASYPELSFQRIPEGSTHVYHLLSARYDGQAYGKTRDDLIDLLAFKYRIQAIVQYYPLDRYPLFSKVGRGEADCPNTDAFFDNMLSLPFYPWFSDEQFSYLIDSLKASLDILRQGKA
jgi:perosamine synthetase